MVTQKLDKIQWKFGSGEQCILLQMFHAEMIWVFSGADGSAPEQRRQKAVSGTASII